MLKKRSSIVLAALMTALPFGALISAPAAQAAPVYGTTADLTGSRTAAELTGGTNPGGLEFLRSDPGELTLSWDITDNGNGTYNYLYTINGTLRNDSVSHFTFDVSDDCDGSQGCVTDVMINGSPTTAVEFGDIDGITGAVKIDTGSDMPTQYSFTSTRAPVWHDIFIKEGIWDVRNVGFGNRTSEDTNLYVATPNGAPTQMPVPGSIGLLGVGLIGLGLYARRQTNSSLLRTGL